MTDLPKSCRDCAEYGSDFCDDCLQELSNNLSEPDKITLNKALRNIAKALDHRHETLGSKDSKNS